MKRAKDSVHAPDSSPTGGLQRMLSLLSVGLIGAVLASSMLITGDSVSVSNGDTLPQILLILMAVLVASLAGWNCVGFELRSRNDPLSVPVSRLPIALLCLAIGCLLLSTLSATFRADGRAAWNNFWHIVALLLFVMLTAQVTHRATMVRALVQLAILCAVFQATFALHQYFVSMPAARAEYLIDPDGSILKAQIDAPPGSEVRAQYENRLLGSFEPPGTFALTNSLAVLLSGAIVALAYALLQRGTQRQVLATWACRAMLIFLIGAWLLTKSRSGYLAVAIVGVTMVAFRFVKRAPAVDRANTPPRQGLELAKDPLVLVALIGLILVGAFIGLLSSDRMVISEAPKSILYRLEYWQATSRMILDYPLTGVGFGNFQNYYPTYKLPAASEVIADPHNWLFDLAANGSILLLVVAVLGLCWALRQGSMQAGASDNENVVINQPSDRLWLIVFWSGALLSFCVVGFLQLILRELIDFDATMLGLFASLACAWILNWLPMTERGWRWSAWAGLVTMLIVLLSSGCWQASGMALPMAVWLAIGCPARANSQSALTQHESGKASMVTVILAIVMLAAFLAQTWQPVQGSWALEQQAIDTWQRGREEPALDLAKQAIATDRLSTSPRRLLAQLLMERATVASRLRSSPEFSAAADQVDVALKDLLNGNPVSNLSQSFAGECNLVLAAGCLEWNSDLAKQRVTQAAEHYQQAVDRYPTSVALRAQLATVAAWLDLNRDGQLSGRSSEQLSEAYSLSELTPHTNRKLASQQLFLPGPLARQFPAEAIVRPAKDGPWAKAEPLADYLRKLIDK